MYLQNTMEQSNIISTTEPLSASETEKHVSEPHQQERQVPVVKCTAKKAPQPPVVCCEPCCTIKLHRHDPDKRCSRCNQRLCMDHYLLANNPSHYGTVEFRGMCNFCNWDSIT